MGEIFIEGLPFTIQIEGDAPNKDEAQRILKLVEKLDTVKDTGEEALRELEDQYGFNIPLLDEAMISEEKKNAINLLDDFGFVDKKELSPLEKLGIDRTTAGIIGSMALSAGGFKDMFNLKEEANLAKLYKRASLIDPRKLAIAGGKTYFGGVFGDIAGRTAFDIANFILTGDPDMLQFLNTIDADAKEAMFYEALGLGIPEIVAGGFRLLTNLKDPSVRAAYDAAERLGIQLNFGQIAKYAGGARALSPLPFIGTTVRKTIGKQRQILNEKFQALKEKFAPISLFSTSGIDVFKSVNKRFDIMSRNMARLWDRAYKSHAMLPNRNVFRTDDVQSFFTKFINGDILRQFKNIPTNDQGIINSYESIVKSGFFENQGLSRAMGPSMKDFIETLRRYQITMQKQGNKVSYDTIRNFNDDISGLFRDLVENQGGTFRNEFAKVLTQFRVANDELLLNLDKNLIKDLIPEDMLAGILQNHKNANDFTRAFKQLYESPAGNIFGTYVKNIFKPGFIQDKKARDQILTSLMRVKSPSVLRDLEKIMGKDSFRIFANEYLSNAIARSVADTSQNTAQFAKGLDFEPAILAKELGFDIRGKDEFVDAFFKSLGINKQEVKDIITSGAFIESIKIGNPSQFLQRRFQLTGAQNILGSFLGGAGASYMGTQTFSEDDGIFTKGFKGLLTLMALRYGVGKVFANPKLAKNIQDVYEPGRQLNFSTKIDLVREIFNLHHDEAPEEIGSTLSMFQKVQEDLSGVLDEVELDAINDLILELQDRKNKFEVTNELDIETEELESLREDEGEELQNDVPIEIEEKPEPDDVSFNIPSPNINMNMANVVPPISSAQLDPALVQRLSSVGLPLFANEGGIATLMNKPQQMVA